MKDRTASPGRRATADDGAKRPARSESAPGKCRVDTRRDGDGLTVVATLPGANREEVTVGIESEATG